MVIKVPRLEADLGIEIYASKTKGINGKIRSLPEDFIVEEILIDGSKASIQLDKRIIPPSGHGRYLVCVLIKKGWDTLTAVRKLADSIGVDQERIGVAGMKDAEALTAQHISIGGVSPENIFKVSLKDITLRTLGFSNQEISSKLLFGNQFTIMARSIEYTPSTVQRRIEKIRRELTDLGGFPNFFGHQRFGTVRPITHQVGRCLVKGDYKNATLIFLSQPSPYEHPEARNARRLLRDTEDFRMALKSFPKSLIYERLMLKGLSRYPRDYLGALHRLPANLSRLFVHAYQSFLFNRFLSERIKRNLPLDKAQVGDYLVTLDEKSLPTNRFSKAQECSITTVNEEISKAQKAIALPLIGFKQDPSGGVQGEIEKEILEEEGVNPQDFRISKIPKAITPGGLRTVLARVLNLDITEEADSTGSCPISVMFSFALHRGSYATVLLREFMKPKTNKKLINSGF